MRYACIYYSIVRFAPFAETEEFANVGIVLSAPAIKRMEYRLASEHLERVNRFFDFAAVFAKALEMAKNELDAQGLQMTSLHDISEMLKQARSEAKLSQQADQPCWCRAYYGGTHGNTGQR